MHLKSISKIGIFFLFLVVSNSVRDTMAEKSPDTKPEKEQEDEDEGYDPNALTAEQIMNLPDYEPDEDDDTEGMTIDEIMERANQRSDAMYGNSGPQEDGTYIVQGDIAMTKEDYEQYMADWKVEEAKLIAEGKINPSADS